MRETLTTMCLVAAAGGALLACGSATGPGGASLCATGLGVEVCAAKSEYSPGDIVETTVRNTTSESLYVDVCSLKPAGKTDRDRPFETDYLPGTACGPDVDLDEIRSRMVEVAPGATARFEPRLPTFAFQGFYRVNVWLLDANGERVNEVPAFSGTFVVFPSAGS